MPRDRDVEGVLHGAGRVIGRDVERLEVVPVVLDLGAADHAESERGEDADDLAFDEGERVQRSGPRRAAGERDVDRVGGELRLLRHAAELVAASVSRRDQVRSDRVHPCADLALVAVGQRAERPLELPERRLPSEDADLRGIELLERGRGRERGPTARVFVVERAQQLGSFHGGRV